MTASKTFLINLSQCAKKVLTTTFGLSLACSLFSSVYAVPDTRPEADGITNKTEDCDSGQILTSDSCTGDGLSSEERKLYDLINEYRLQNGLPPIPLSASLTLVANRHVQDLEKNVGQLTHGWSDCPYDGSNAATYPCMWEAPQRLGTSYPGNGYENAHGGSGGYVATAESAFQSWRGSSLHNAVILNQGIWNNREWQALGIGIYGGYAVLWFGEEADPAGGL